MSKFKINTTLNYSPNFDLKKRKPQQIKFIIFHYTGMRKEKDAIKKLTNNTSKVSSHYLIKNNETIALVTSSFHMPRSLKLISDNRFKVIPVSVDQRATNQKFTFLSFLPSSGALNNNSLVVRELLGRIYYSLKIYFK